ncbi:hypothetical protein Y032_0103g3556 [Ancylostoma ceylanicum]|uniref:Uncharacterized protein n=1 Tax=Ancylostoma ceylanicum TaxID=53326 RepID=A0A016TH65_9BILA|nr:hypothetical protein Y032_0103g3556 [Ancylostoma ceylanicum]
MLPSINVALVKLSIFVIHIHILTWTIKACSCLKRKPPAKKVEVKHEKKRLNKEIPPKQPPTSSGSITTPSAPADVWAYPLAPTPPDEPPPSKEGKSAETGPKKRSKEKHTRDKDADSRKLLPYPEVKPPTISQKKRRERELEREKKEKIASGFYQSRSDEDDTLEKVNSLKEELTEHSRKLRSMKLKPGKGDKKGEKKEGSAQLPPPPPPPPPPKP